MIVVDASFLVVALANDGAEGHQARQRLRGEELAAPHIIDLEVASVIRKGLHAGRITAKRARQAFEDLGSFDLERVAHTSLLPRIWELRDNCTAYDAAYIALAELFRVPLVTCDGKMAGASGARCTFEVFQPS
ncbi:MAG TPA: type II toxin-antitoxin system VapC family toxin [Streptosporangiaceae bacterium]